MAGETRPNSNFEPEAENPLLAGNDLSKIALSPEEEAELESLLFGEPMPKSTAEPRQTLRQIRSQINQQRQKATGPLKNPNPAIANQNQPNLPPLPQNPQVTNQPIATPPPTNFNVGQPNNQPPSGTSNAGRMGPSLYTSTANPLIDNSVKTGSLPPNPAITSNPKPAQPNNARPKPPNLGDTKPLQPNVNSVRPPQPPVSNVKPPRPSDIPSSRPPLNVPRTAQAKFESPSSFVPDAFDAFDAPPRPAPKPSQASSPLEKPQVAKFGDEPSTARFRPGAISSQPVKKKGEKWTRWDVIWAIVEAVVIVLIVIIIGYFLLENFAPQFLQPNLSSGGSAANNNLSLLSSNGAVINVDAGHTILNIPTPAATTAQATNTQAATATAAATASTIAATNAPTFAPFTIGASAAALVGGAATPTPVLAPTATPVPANPVVSQPVTNTANSPTPAVDYSQSPPLRLVIPKINLDTPVKDVTVKLGSWQVADYAAGHNLGTANPGEIGNMVIAGHRDIRGSVFLRLPELQKGDTFTVYSNAGVFHYVVTDTYIVDPTDISVMNPTTDAIATLITCTPLGTSNRRFIVRAKLVN